MGIARADMLANQPGARIDMTQLTASRLPSRVLTLEGGSNFRDIGGYQSEDGRFVRWRCLFRSGAFGQLTQHDLEVLHDLQVRTIVDLRCREERELAPSLWGAPTVCSIDYPQEVVFEKALGSEAWQLYEVFLELLSGHLRFIFDALRVGETPLVVHCSGGQDRTGVTIAILLATLGVSMDQIRDDYMYSTAARRRANEVDLRRVRELTAHNPVAAFYAKQIDERGVQSLDPKPLFDSLGRPKIMLAFDVLEKRWGSLDRYLQSQCHLDQQDIQELRNRYLEIGT